MKKRVIDGLRLMYSIEPGWSDEDIAEAYSGSSSEAIVSFKLAKSDIHRAFCTISKKINRLMCLSEK